jgi:hypothetical protein
LVIALNLEKLFGRGRQAGGVFAQAGAAFVYGCAVAAAEGLDGVEQ